MCGDHFAKRITTNKVIIYGYQCSNLKDHAKEVTRQQEACEKYETFIHLLVRELNSIIYPLPFARRGLNIVGIMPNAKDSKRYIMVFID